MLFTSSRNQKANRRKNKTRRKQRRRLRGESLEHRRVLALLGIQLNDPLIDYDNNGSASYDSTTNIVSVDTSPTAFSNGGQPGLFFGGSFDFNIEVDETGSLVGGVPGDDLVLVGDLDTNFDFTVDFSGTLLTGEVTGFGFADQGVSDDFDYTFTVTGGEIAAMYGGVGSTIGVTMDLENSTFVGDFNVDFGGAPAKGTIGNIEATEPMIDIMKFVDKTIVTETMFQVDFEGLPAGTIVYDQFPGLTIEAENARVPGADNRAMIFDSANPSGHDHDLGTPNQDFGGPGIGAGGGSYSDNPNENALGNILIISEDGDSSDPDDEAQGGTITFTFDNPVRVDQIDLLDIDSDEAGGSIVTLLTSSGTQSIGIPALGNNSFQTVDINVDDVVSMTVEFVSSGAITELKFTESTEEKVWFDANDPPGPSFNLGEKINFEYKVTNTGDVPIENVVIVDDNATPGDQSDDLSTGSFSLLDPIIGYNNTSTASYDSTNNTFTLDAIPSAFDNSGQQGLFFSGALDINAEIDETGSLVGGVAGPDLNLVGDLDENFDFTVDYSGTLLTAEITDFTAVDQGSSDDFTFTFTVTGGLLASLYGGVGATIGVDLELENSSFTGDFNVDFGGGPAKGNLGGLDEGEIVYHDGDDNGNGILDPGEMWIYHACITADHVGQFTNIATVDGDGATDSDPGNYTVLGVPNIDIEKFTNGADADSPLDNDVPEIAPGAPVTWTYEVTNTGDNPFTFAEVSVVDDNGTPGNSSDDFSPSLDPLSDTNGDQILSPGETWVFIANDPDGADTLGVASGEPTTFYLGGNSPLDGADGNIRSFSADGVTVNASAFSRDSSGDWDAAFLGQFSSGLGVTDTSEGNGSNGKHRVDNIHRDNYVLFEFSETVIVDAAYLASVQQDSDVSVWFGTVPDAFNNHISLSDAVLADLAFEDNNTNKSRSRWANFNGNEVAGNVLIIAASVTDSSPEDQFKIKKVKAERIDPGVYGNLASVVAGTVSDSDMSHYRNEVPADSGHIGNFVWNDVNMNGRQDSGESGISGVTVNLLDGQGGFLQTTTTDSDGQYSFTGLPEGEYLIEFIAPGDYVFSPKGLGANADNGSNANPVTGITDPVWLDAHEVDNTIDAGLYKAAVEVMFEAEDYSHKESPWQTYSSGSASGGEFIKAPNGSGSHYNHVPHGKSVHYDFSVSEDGVYELSGLVKAKNSKDNSLWVRVNNQPWVQWHMDVTGHSFEWQSVTDGFHQDATTFDLDFGQNHLEIKVREDGTKIDKFMVSKIEFNTVIISANDYIAGGGDWIVDHDEDGNEFLVAGGNNHYHAPDVGDVLTYSFDIAEAGTYHVFGHVSANNDGDNSFWVRIDGGEWAQWHLTVTGEGNWEWQVVTHGFNHEAVTYDLSEGTHTLEISIRENGTLVDLWAISDDENFNG